MAKILFFMAFLPLCLITFFDSFGKIVASFQAARTFNIYSDIVTAVGSGSTTQQTILDGSGNTLTGIVVETAYSPTHTGKRIKVFIPEILVAPGSSFLDSDTVFEGLDFTYGHYQYAKGGNDYLVLGKDSKTKQEQRLFLNYLYLYCIDTNTSGICDSGEAWKLR